MRTEELRSMLRTIPFVTFRITAANGSVHTVSNPEFCLVSQDNRTLYIYDEIDPVKNYKLIDVMLIATIEIGEPF